MNRSRPWCYSPGSMAFDGWTRMTVSSRFELKRPTPRALRAIDDDTRSEAARLISLRQRRIAGCKEDDVVDPERALLQHFLAAVAYRTQKALRDAPAWYPEFSAGHHARTPVEILRHMTSLLGYSRTLFLDGRYPVKPEALPTFADEIARFHDLVGAVGDLLSSSAPLREISLQQLLQGPLSDLMTHVGQLALLRRLADAPVAPESFVHADIRSNRLGADQPKPARPDIDWPERPVC